MCVSRCVFGYLDVTLLSFLYFDPVDFTLLGKTGWLCVRVRKYQLIYFLRGVSFNNRHHLCHCLSSCCSALFFLPPPPSQSCICILLSPHLISRLWQAEREISRWFPWILLAGRFLLPNWVFFPLAPFLLRTFPLSLSLSLSFSLSLSLSFSPSLCSFLHFARGACVGCLGRIRQRAKSPVLTTHFIKEWTAFPWFPVCHSFSSFPFLCFPLVHCVSLIQELHPSIWLHPTHPSNPTSPANVVSCIGTYYAGAAVSFHFHLYSILFPTLGRVVILLLSLNLLLLFFSLLYASVSLSPSLSVHFLSAHLLHSSSFFPLHISLVLALSLPVLSLTFNGLTPTSWVFCLFHFLFHTHLSLLLSFCLSLQMNQPLPLVANLVSAFQSFRGWPFL